MKQTTLLSLTDQTLIRRPEEDSGRVISISIDYIPGIIKECTTLLRKASSRGIEPTIFPVKVESPSR